MTELGIRLSAVAGMAEKGKCIADIGCDHGFVSIALVQNHIAERMIACDINKGPLEHARHNVALCNLEEKIDLRLGDGIKPIKPGETDGGIIAGMGGPLGLRILYEGREIVKEWKQVILQLQSKLQLMRFVLDRWGFETVSETMVTEEGKFYPILRLVPPEKGDFYETDIPDFDSFLENAEKEMQHESTGARCGYAYGELLLEERNPILLAFLGKEEDRLLGIMEKLEKQDEQKERLAEVVAEIDMLMLAKWKIQGR